nr:cobalamin B12-binding domain-containing protein [Desulfobacterales bacterium]
MEVEVYKPRNNIRVVTATSLFDGHDASINIMRRILQNTGAEVIHLGHNRSVQEFVDAAIEEDVQGMALSSYQGGHMEFFKYMVDMLKEKGASHIKIFGGGGGVIVPDEIKELEEYGVTKIYSPEDGAKMGLQGIINHMIKAMDYSTVEDENIDISNLSTENKPLIAKLITAVVQAKAGGNGQLEKLKSALLQHPCGHKTAVIGITGTGGAGKSSLTDELVQRILHDFKNINIAIISSDPS